jgi:hypothetical protein
MGCFVFILNTKRDMTFSYLLSFQVIFFLIPRQSLGMSYKSCHINCMNFYPRKRHKVKRGRGAGSFLAGGRIGRSLYSDKRENALEERGLIPMFRSASRLRDRDCSRKLESPLSLPLRLFSQQPTLLPLPQQIISLTPSVLIYIGLNCKTL